MKLPLVPVATRWNSWFNAARYHSYFIQFYEGFFKQVDRILELIDGGRLHHASFLNLRLNLYFITENCTRLIKAFTSWEETKSPLAWVVYMMEDAKQYLHAGISKSTFRLETDRLLSELKTAEREKVISNFQDLFSVSFPKLHKYLEAHPVYNFYKVARIFDPRQLPCITPDIDSLAAIKDFQDPSTELLEEFQIYVNYKDDLPNHFNIPAFWNANKSRFPLLQ